MNEGDGLGTDGLPEKRKLEILVRRSTASDELQGSRNGMRLHAMLPVGSPSSSRPN